MLKKTVKHSSRDIAAALEGMIRERGLEHGVRLSTSVQLAEKFGVSTKTVHRAVERLVSKGMVYRIRGSGTYVAENKPEAAKLNVGLFLWKQQSGVTMLDQVAFDSFADDLESGIRALGHRVEVFMEGIARKWTCQVKTMQLEKFDVIVAAAGVLEVADERLRHFPGQVILINDDILHPGPWHQVIYDYHAGFGKALRHLRSMGIWKIFVPGAAGVEVCVRRFQALREEALRDGFREEDIEFHEGDCGSLRMMVMAGRDCGKYFLGHCGRDTAIISVSDYLSVGMRDVFAENGIELGRDVKLVSYDNLEAGMRGHGPVLGFTAITHPMADHARAVAAMLEELEKKGGRNSFYRVHVVPATELVIRTSA